MEALMIKDREGDVLDIAYAPGDTMFLEAIEHPCDDTPARRAVLALDADAVRRLLAVCEDFLRTPTKVSSPT